MAHGSTKAVLTAIVANGIVTVIKFFAALLSGSAAMLNEAVHSLMDTANQAFLYLGLRESAKPADNTYAFGHGQKKYLWNLWSAIGLFSIGAGIGLTHAWHSWVDRAHHTVADPLELFGHSISTFWINLLVLLIALLLEGYSFLVALKEYLRRMRADGHGNPFTYLTKAGDPTLLAVVMEDSAAMLGLALAALGITLTAITAHPEYDIIFSALIALMLGAIAFYLGYTNMRFLSDVRDTQAERIFRDVVREHPEVERYHDLRSVVVDELNTVLVAEIELREEAVVPGLFEDIAHRRTVLLSRFPIEDRMKQRVRYRVTARVSVEATLERTEKIVDQLEAELKARLPRIAHVTLEVQGIRDNGAVAPELLDLEKDTEPAHDDPAPA